MADKVGQGNIWEHRLAVLTPDRLEELHCQLAAAKEREAARFTAPIVCLCGSTRFKQSWIAENARLTGDGNIVLAVGLWGHHERKYPTPEVKKRLDDLHKRKIDLCDWVFVLDVGRYVGESTRSEIEYAKKLGRPIRYLSDEFPDYVEPVDELQAEVERLREREAALAAALEDTPTILEFIASTGIWVCDEEWQITEPDQDDERDWVDYSSWSSGLLERLKCAGVNPAAILARVRREAKREAMEGLPASMSRPRLSDYPDDEERMEREAFALGFNAYRTHVDAALAALDAEEKGEQG